MGLMQWIKAWETRRTSADVLRDFVHAIGGSHKVDPTPSNPYYDKDGRPIWLARALSYVGTHEFAGADDNPVILQWAKGDGGEISSSYTHDAIPWCKLFEVTMLRESGLQYQDSLWALDTVNEGHRLSGPVVGAMASMKRSGGGHVAFVVGRDEDGNLMCVGGNQSDAVNIKPFDPARVVSYNWPIEVPLPDKVGFDFLPVVDSDGVVSRDEQ